MKTEIQEQKPSNKFGDVPEGSLFYTDGKLWVKWTNDHCNALPLDGESGGQTFRDDDAIQEVLSLKATVRS